MVDMISGDMYVNQLKSTITSCWQWTKYSYDLQKLHDKWLQAQFGISLYTVAFKINNVWVY